jgi:hypothetical protein
MGNTNCCRPDELNDQIIESDPITSRRSGGYPQDRLQLGDTPNTVEVKAKLAQKKKEVKWLKLQQKRADLRSQISPRRMKRLTELAEYGLSHKAFSKEHILIHEVLPIQTSL